jgi:hypothetical protein
MSGKTVDGQRVLTLGRGACGGVRVARASVLTVRSGRAWVTIERDAADYWLAPGEAVPLAAGERVWIGGWDDAVCCELAPLVPVVPVVPLVPLRRRAALSRLAPPADRPRPTLGARLRRWLKSPMRAGS